MALSARPVVTVTAVLLLLLAGMAPAAALVTQLSPADIEQAIALGRRSLVDEEFGDEWRVALPDGGAIQVTTPFARLAQAARQAAFKGEELTDKQRQEAIDRGKGKLQLTVTTFGRAPDFARWYQPVLRIQDRDIKATFTQNERTARRLEDGRYEARNIYVFATEGIPPGGTVVLIVRHAVEQKEVMRASLPLGQLR